MWDDLRYRVTEYVRTVGWKRLLFRLLLVVGVVYLLLPESQPMPERFPVPQQQAAPKMKNTPQFPRLEGVASDEDLREQMTTRQSRFYWRSFHWMMSHGKAHEKRDFNDQVISLSYLAGETFTSPSQHVCRPYAEEIIMAGKMNRREGIACRVGEGQWCRQEKGEKPRCRFVDKGGIAGFKQGWDMQMHNFGIDWNRNMQALPSF